MVLRHVTVELTEKQYETLCRMTANAGMPVADVIQAFAEELPGNSALDGWLKQHQRKNFLSYLCYQLREAEWKLNVTTYCYSSLVHSCGQISCSHENLPA